MSERLDTTRSKGDAINEPMQSYQAPLDSPEEPFGVCGSFAERLPDGDRKCDLDREPPIYYACMPNKTILDRAQRSWAIEIWACVHADYEG